MLFICFKKEAVWMWSRQLDLETLSFGISFPSSIITTFSPVSENSLSQTCPDLIPKDHLLVWISLQTCSSFPTSLFPFLRIFSKKNYYYLITETFLTSSYPPQDSPLSYILVTKPYYHCNFC